MLILLIRNEPKGSAITGRLVIDGRWFCNTLERVGYQIPALCYPVRVTQSPKFKRLLPIVQNVPRFPMGGTPSNRAKSVQYPAAECRSGIRFHRGSKPEHSTGCILTLADNPTLPATGAQPLAKQAVPTRSVATGRSAAEVERTLTNLILKSQQDHEDIILEVIDFRPGTALGYDTPCPPELQQHEIDARRATERYNQLHSEKCE